MKVTDQKNFTAGSLYIALGGAVAIGSLGFSIGTAERMGPGFFPLGVGILLAVTGIVLVLGAIGRGATGSRLGSWALKPILIVTAAVIAFGLLLEPGGLHGRRPGAARRLGLRPPRGLLAHGARQHRHPVADDLADLRRSCSGCRSACCRRGWRTRRRRMELFGNLLLGFETALSLAERCVSPSSAACSAR